MQSGDWIWLAAMIAALWGIYKFSASLIRAILAVNNWVRSIEANTHAQDELQRWLKKLSTDTDQKFSEFGDRLEVVEGIVLIPNAERAG